MLYVCVCAIFLCKQLQDGGTLEAAEPTHRPKDVEKAKHLMQELYKTRKLDKTTNDDVLEACPIQNSTPVAQGFSN